MDKYLIFRNDRIGDFLLTAILINSIKRNNPNTHISVVASKKNYEYIKTFDYIDKVFLLENSFVEKIKFTINLRSIYYNFVIIHDNKNRSLLISKFLKYSSRILIDYNLKDSHINVIKSILAKLNFSFSKNDLDILKNRNLQNISNIDKNYIVFHFDEKWMHNNYIKNYTNIEPNENQLEIFINSIHLKTKKKIVVTTGKIISEKLNNVINKINNPNIFFFKSINFIMLENLVAKSSLLISCHGAISHICAAYNIEQIDIIEQKKLDFYNLWTDHFRNYKKIYRKDFQTLSDDILNLL